jgi:hypothetical protein
MSENHMTVNASGCGCGAACHPDDRAPRADAPLSLPIVWQRLVSDEGETCDRCGATETAVQRAVATLTEALRPLGIEPKLDTRAIDQATFKAAPSESNRIWIAGQPIEAWVGADVGASPCCSVCGDSPCRTLEVDGTTYEALPEPLLVRAGLVAAAAVLGA